jgi:hypothetical protein
MMATQEESLANWHRFIQQHDEHALAAALSEEVVYHSPLLWAPNNGKTPTIVNLTSAARVLEDFTYHQQFTGDNSVAFVFSAHIGAIQMRGVDIIQFGSDGLISHLEVCLRTSAAMAVLSEGIIHQLTLKLTAR